MTNSGRMATTTVVHSDRQDGHAEAAGPSKSPRTLTNLGGGQTLLGQLKDLLLDVIRGEFQPLKVKKRR